MVIAYFKCSFVIYVFRAGQIANLFLRTSVIIFIAFNNNKMQNVNWNMNCSKVGRSIKIC